MGDSSTFEKKAAKHPEMQANIEALNPSVCAIHLDDFVTSGDFRALKSLFGCLWGQKKQEIYSKDLVKFIEKPRES